MLTVTVNRSGRKFYDMADCLDRAFSSQGGTADRAAFDANETGSAGPVPSFHMALAQTGI